MAHVMAPRTIGRQHELRVLGDSLTRSRSGLGSCIALVGPAGIGKSRLARETASQAAEGGSATLVGRATPAGNAGAFRPLIEIVGQALRTSDPGGPGVDERLLAQVAALRPGGGSGRYAEGGTTLLAEAVVGLLAHVARPRGLVAILEDVHWADPDTVAVVEYLADNVERSGTCLLLTVRNESRSEALEMLDRRRADPRITRLDLEPLSDHDIARLIAECVPDTPPDVAALVAARAEGNPLLVEELLGTQGIPRSFRDAVAMRLADASAQARETIEAASILGRHFDWRLLAGVTGLGEADVSMGLEEGVGAMLLDTDGHEIRFRHALTREAVTSTMLPPRRVELARAALEEVRRLHPDLDGPWLELAADLAVQAERGVEAADLLARAGRDALSRGALATAAAVLDRAVDHADPARAAELHTMLVEAQALAGHYEAAAATAAPLLRDPGAVAPAACAQIRLTLAHSAVEAGRWSDAACQVDAARKALDADPDDATAVRLALIESEIALGSRQLARAHDLARDALAAPGANASSRCQALEILGRVARVADPASARAHFRRALEIAEGAGLDFWRMRALHELGTIDMFELLNDDRLNDARALASRLGAARTGAVIDLQLAAVHISRWEPDLAGRHAHAALSVAGALGNDEVATKARLFLAEAAALSGDEAAVEEQIRTLVGDGDRSLDAAYAWGARGELALVLGDVEQTTSCLCTAMEIFSEHERAEPAAFRALTPLVLAVVRDNRAHPALEDARVGGVGAFALNRGLLAHAEAVLLARQGEVAGALDGLRGAIGGFSGAPVWHALARALTAKAARDDGWGEPGAWLEAATGALVQHHLEGLLRWCRSDTGGPRPTAGAAITPRELDVLELVAEGMANKEIAQHLGLSPRTVEKHVEALLRKTASRSRAQLAVRGHTLRIAQPPSSTSSR